MLREYLLNGLWVQSLGTVHLAFGMVGLQLIRLSNNVVDDSNAVVNWRGSFL